RSGRPYTFRSVAGRTAHRMRTSRTSRLSLIGGLALACAVTSSTTPAAMSGAHAAPRLVPAHAAGAPVDRRAIIETYCLECHDDDHQKGDLSLEAFDPSKPELRSEVAEKMIRKLRAGMMPPPGKDRPAGDGLDAFAASLETRLDALAEANPNPGHRSFQ